VDSFESRNKSRADLGWYLWYRNREMTVQWGRRFCRLRLDSDFWLSFEVWIFYPCVLSWLKVSLRFRGQRCTTVKIWLTKVEWLNVGASLCSGSARLCEAWCRALLDSWLLLTKRKCSHSWLPLICWGNCAEFFFFWSGFKCSELVSTCHLSTMNNKLSKLGRFNFISVHFTPSKGVVLMIVFRLWCDQKNEVLFAWERQLFK